MLPGASAGAMTATVTIFGERDFCLGLPRDMRPACSTLLPTEPADFSLAVPAGSKTSLRLLVRNPGRFERCHLPIQPQSSLDDADGKRCACSLAKTHPQ